MSSTEGHQIYLNMEFDDQELAGLSCVSPKQSIIVHICQIDSGFLLLFLLVGFVSLLLFAVFSNSVLAVFRLPFYFCYFDWLA